MWFGFHFFYFVYDTDSDPFDVESYVSDSEENTEMEIIDSGTVLGIPSQLQSASTYKNCKT